MSIFFPRLPGNSAMPRPVFGCAMVSFYAVNWTFIPLQENWPAAAWTALWKWLFQGFILNAITFLRLGNEYVLHNDKLKQARRRIMNSDFSCCTMQARPDNLLNQALWRGKWRHQALLDSSIHRWSRGRKQGITVSPLQSVIIICGLLIIAPE